MKKKNLAAVLLLCVAAFALVGCSGKSKTLFTAAEENNVAQTRRLIKSGADVNARERDGWTALMYAERRKATDAAALPKAAGAKE